MTQWSFINVIGKISWKRRYYPTMHYAFASQKDRFEFHSVQYMMSWLNRQALSWKWSHLKAVCMSFYTCFVVTVFQKWMNLDSQILIFFYNLLLLHFCYFLYISISCVNVRNINQNCIFSKQLGSKMKNTMEYLKQDKQQHGELKRLAVAQQSVEIVLPEH